MIHLLINQFLPILLFFSISSFTIPCCYGQSLSSSCSRSSIDISNSTLNSNVNSLLNSLSPKAAFNSFYNQTSNGMYGLFLCRGDVSGEDCRKCVSSASEEIKRLCSSQTDAIIWYDNCTLRYSVTNFFGNLETSPGFFMWNVDNITSPDESDTEGNALMYRLIDDATKSDTMFAANDSGSTNARFGLVQCTRDIDKSECGNCLTGLMNRIKNCCEKRKGWRYYLPNCFIRYEAVIFYNIPAAPLPPVPAPPPPQPPPDDNGNGGGNTRRIIIITISTVAATVIVLGLLYYSFFSRKKRREMDRSEEFPLRNLNYSDPVHSMRQYFDARDEDGDKEMHYFSLITLKVATDDFSDANRLGEGGFGPVYKGKLIGGEEIAVKRLSAKSSQGHEEFKNEAKVILKLQHKNLVRLLGCCLEGDEKLLVYEFMSNTSLDAFLFDPLKCKQLDWLKRENIVNGIARGILYLHEDSRLKIIHRDLKASNVLLDDEMNPKISDFGTARIFGGKQIDANTNRIVGTYGYMAPEYAMEGLFSVKSDVYSFGVLMLEVISGKKSIGFLNSDRANNLPSHGWELWNKGKAHELRDKNLIGDCPVSEAARWIQIALLCVQEDANMRPNMSMVVLMLGSQSIALPKPSKPPFLSGMGLSMTDQISRTEVEMGFPNTNQSSTTTSI